MKHNKKLYHTGEYTFVMTISPDDKVWVPTLFRSTVPLASSMEEVKQSSRLIWAIISSSFSILSILSESGISSMLAIEESNLWEAWPSDETDSKLGGLEPLGFDVLSSDLKQI